MNTTKIRGYIDGKLFISSDRAITVRYALEQETAQGGKDAMLIYPTGAFNEYRLINGKWKQSL